MAKLFRLACAIDAYLTNPDKTTRPPKPRWLSDDNRENATRNQEHSFRYWTSIYWATPPWINAEQIEEMRRLGRSTPPGCHLDHIVPLKSSTVCGLNVPWNLAHLPEKQNLFKSNNWWPDCPHDNEDLFGEFEPHQMRLL